MRLAAPSLLVAVVACLSACPAASPPYIECADDTSCGLHVGGHCVANPATDHKFCAYPDAACAGGFRWSDYDVEDSISGTCVAPVPAFDVVYPTEWKINILDTPITGFLMVVNTSDHNLPLGSMELVSVTDDHPTTLVRITAAPSTASLGPGTAGGYLTPSTATLFAPLAAEPRQDIEGDYLRLEFIDAVPGTYDIAVTMTLRIDGVTVDLPMTIHIVPIEAIPVVWMEPIAADRKATFHEIGASAQ